MLNRTIADVRRRAKLQDRVAAETAEVIATMCKGGEALHHHHDRQGPVWWLSHSGRRVPDNVARLVITSPNVVNVGDGLPFGSDVAAQTFRFASTK
jgi:hypothetical protein